MTRIEKGMFDDHMVPMNGKVLFYDMLVGINYSFTMNSNATKMIID